MVMVMAGHGLPPLRRTDFTKGGLASLSGGRGLAILTSASHENYADVFSLKFSGRGQIEVYVGINAAEILLCSPPRQLREDEIK